MTDSRVILVTGCSTGLGMAIAVQAAQAGHRVWASMRDLSRRAALDAAAAKAGVRLQLVALDVQDSASIASAVDQVITAEGRIDTLINNAGAGCVRSTEQASEAEVGWVMDVNYMGVVRCTKAVLPHMRQARTGHVIAISSVGGLVGQPFNEFYCAAKFAVEGYMESLASYVGPAFGLHFSLIEPGGIATEFAANVMRHVDATGGLPEDEYLPILQRYISGAQQRHGNNSDIYQTPDQVAQVVMQVVATSDPPIRCRTSDWSRAFCALKTDADPDGRKLRDQVVAQFLGDL